MNIPIRVFYSPNRKIKVLVKYKKEYVSIKFVKCRKFMNKKHIRKKNKVSINNQK